MIFDEGQLLDGVYLLVKGAVSMQLVRQGEVAEIAAVGPGAVLRRSRYAWNAVRRLAGRCRRGHRGPAARPDTVRQLFEASPTLARDTGRVLDVRRKALQSARTALRRH